MEKWKFALLGAIAVLLLLLLIGAAAVAGGVLVGLMVDEERSYSSMTYSRLVPEPLVMPEVDHEDRAIWVTGESTVSAEPDVAILSLGVEARAETVSEATTEASTAMGAVHRALLDRHIEDMDIRTSRFNIRPNYQYQEQGPSILVGYVVRNDVRVRVRELDTLSAVIDDVVTAGGDATRIDDIRFAVEDMSPYVEELRMLAVEDARKEANVLADAANVVLGDAVMILGDFSIGSLPLSFSTFAQKDIVHSIGSGELDLQISVTVQFEILR